MGAIGKKLRRARGMGEYAKELLLLHWCPGCDEPHGIRIEGREGSPKWTFNGNFDRPTFSPSVLNFTIYDDEGEPLPQGQRRTLCHYFITDGQIQFCGDSPHELAGQTVDLPDWPYAPGTFGGIEDADQE
jgi:hypothetical protein